MSNLVNHARFELEAAGYFDKEGIYDGMIGPAVMSLVEVFAEQGHSGMSAGIVLSLFNAVASFKPIGPLTGEDSEWGEPFDDEGTRQNKRCSRVFRRADGTAYDINGIVFVESGEHGDYKYTNRDSRVEVAFPYTPKTEYVRVDGAGRPLQ